MVGYGALRLESASITHHGSGRVSLDLKVSGYPMSAEEGELLLAMLREEQKIKPGAVVTPDRRPGRRRMNLGGTGA